MTLAAERDTTALRAGVERWLGRPVGRMARAPSGWSCETLVVETELVLRLPPAGDGIFPTYDLAQQAAVQEAAASAGVPVASPATYEPDESYFGAGFLVMPFVDGPIPDQFTLADPWLGSLDHESRHCAWREFLATCARINSVPVEGLGLRCGLHAELDYWESYAQWATDGASLPTLSDALTWCRDNRPRREPTGRLLWGDVRLGNVVFDPKTHVPKAVLDWDMAAAGPMEMDLAWFLALDQLQTDLTGQTLAGFGDREEAVACVGQLLRRDLADLTWYEIFALVRAGAVSSRIAFLHERAGLHTMFTAGDNPALSAATARIAAI